MPVPGSRNKLWTFLAGCGSVHSSEANTNPPRLAVPARRSCQIPDVSSPPQAPKPSNQFIRGKHTSPAPRYCVPNRPILPAASGHISADLFHFSLGCISQAFPSPRPPPIRAPLILFRFSSALFSPFSETSATSQGLLTLSLGAPAPSKFISRPCARELSRLQLKLLLLLPSASCRASIRLAKNPAKPLSLPRPPVPVSAKHPRNQTAHPRAGIAKQPRS